MKTRANAAYTCQLHHAMAAPGSEFCVSQLGARLLALETEFAFVMGSDLPPKAGAYSEAEARPGPF